MGAARKDPLGVQPSPVTGSRQPAVGHAEVRRRSSLAARLLEDEWIEHAPQRAIIDELLRYRDDTRDRLGRALSGRRLSQFSQAGKSRTMAQLKREMAAERAAAGLPPNPYQVVIVELDRRMTLKAFYQEVLRKLDDEFWDANVSAKVLENRIADFVRRLCVELLIADEVQHLRSKARSPTASRSSSIRALFRSSLSATRIRLSSSGRMASWRPAWVAPWSSPRSIRREGRLTPGYSRPSVGLWTTCSSRAAFSASSLTSPTT